MSTARGFRNNNPGNLVLTNINWQGKVPNSQNTDGRFEQFTAMHWGIRAMIIDVVGDIVRKNLSTLQKLVNEYAPPFENDTRAYINFVSARTGLQPNDPIPLNRITIQRLIEAKIEIENGAAPFRQYYRSADFERAWAELPAWVLAAMTAGEIRRNPLPTFLVVAVVVLAWLVTYKYVLQPKRAKKVVQA